MKGDLRNGLPHAREEGLLVEHLDGETVIYDTGTREAHCLSPIAAAVFAHCDGHTSLEALAGEAEAVLGKPVPVELVESAVAQLSERGLLDDELQRQPRTSRRQMLGRTAAITGAVMSVPLVTSVTTPALGAVGSCNVGANCAPGQPACSPNSPAGTTCHCLTSDEQPGSGCPTSDINTCQVHITAGGGCYPNCTTCT